MSALNMNTRLKLSAFNGVVTGAIAACFYSTFAGRASDLWPGVHFHPLNYLALVLACGLNTFVFFGLLGLWAPIRRWKGFLLGTIISILGSFLCAVAMGIGNGQIKPLLFGTAFFFPVSAFVGALAGLVLAHHVRKKGQSA